MEPRGPKRGWWAGWQAQATEEPIGERIIEGKVAHLEREVRIFRGLFVLVTLLFAGLGALHLLQPAQPTAEVLRARRIEVLDANGRTAVTLDADKLGGRIALRYSGVKGEPPPPAMFLAAAPEGGTIQLFEPNQIYFAVGLELGDQGQGIVKVRRRNRQLGLELRGPAAETAGGELLVFDSEGKPAVRLATDVAGRGLVSAAGGKR
jgi:hypothetical protein